MDGMQTHQGAFPYTEEPEDVRIDLFALIWPPKSEVAALALATVNNFPKKLYLHLIKLT